MAKIRGARAEYYVAREELRESGVPQRLKHAQLVKLAAKRIVAAQRALETSDVNVSAAKIGEGRHSALLTFWRLAQRTRAQRDRVYAEQQHVMAWLSWS